MSNHINRRPVSEGFRNFLGSIGGISAVLGIFCLLAVGTGGPEKIVYGSIVAIVLGVMLVRYANSLKHIEKEKTGYSSTKNETNNV